MHLITMAHMGEAQGVIETFNLKRKNQNLFEGDELLLLLTGEGPFEAATLSALTLGQHTITNVVNLGIAGSLSPDFKVGEIHPVRTLYLVQDGKPAFKTFVGNSDGLDCITSFERIMDPKKAERLLGMGQLVDREAWGVAYAAKTAGIPFTSYKLISDVAGTPGACELIKEEAFEFSMKLAEYLKSLLNKTVLEENADFKLPGFHFTFTTTHRFQSLLKKISIKEEKSDEETLASLTYLDILEQKISPKERARLLMERMEEKLDPFKRELKDFSVGWTKDLKSKGIDVATDPNWEHERVSIRFEVESDEELKAKIKALDHFSVAPFKDVMEGKLHVE